MIHMLDFLNASLKVCKFESPESPSSEFAGSEFCKFRVLQVQNLASSEFVNCKFRVCKKIGFRKTIQNRPHNQGCRYSHTKNLGHVLEGI
jgi:hypothetical protein